MELLQNEAAFKAWKKKNIYDKDTADQPKEFPCWVETDVQSWNYEEKRAWYLYRADLERMILEMTPTKTNVSMNTREKL